MAPNFFIEFPVYRKKNPIAFVLVLHPCASDYFRARGLDETQSRTNVVVTASIIVIIAIIIVILLLQQDTGRIWNKVKNEKVKKKNDKKKMGHCLSALYWQIMWLVERSCIVGGRTWYVSHEKLPAIVGNFSRSLATRLKKQTMRWNWKQRLCFFLLQFIYAWINNSRFMNKGSLIIETEIVRK